MCSRSNRHGRVDLVPFSGRWGRNEQAQAPHRETSPSTGRPASSITCSTRGRRVLLSRAARQSLRDGKANLMTRTRLCGTASSALLVSHRAVQGQRPAMGTIPSGRASPAAQEADRAPDRQDPGKRPDPDPDADLSGRGPRSRSYSPRGRSRSATSARRSAPGTSGARWSALRERNR